MYVCQDVKCKLGETLTNKLCDFITQNHIEENQI